MQEKPIDFSTYLKQLLDERHMNVTTLARIMNQPSTTTIHRILRGKTRIETDADFLEKMRACEKLALSKEEIRSLTQALEVSQVGMEQYMRSCAIESIVSEPLPDEGPIETIFYRQDGSRFICSLGDLTDQLLAGGGKVQIYLTGNVRTCMMVRIHRDVLARYPEQTSLEHYVCCSASETIYAMSLIMPVLYDKNYHMYIVSEDQVTPEVASFYRSSSAIIKADLPSGNRYFSMYITDRTKATLVEYVSAHTFEGKLSIYQIVRDRFRSIKIQQPLSGMSEDYLRYTEWYYNMEHHGTATYMVRADIPIMFFHPDIMVPACMDGFSAANFCPPEQLQEIIQSYYKVQLMRYNNFFATRKEHHIVFSWKPMLHFARYGETTDQFFAIRPFTTQERVRILCDLRDQTLSRKNNFHVYFLKSEEDLIRDEITYYKGQGVYFCQGKTDYNLEQHSEALIVEEEFCRSYEAYFTGHLLPHRVKSEADSLKVLQQLISIAANQVNPPPEIIN